MDANEETGRTSQRELSRLQAEIRRVRQERMTIRRQAGDRHSVELAIETAARDRDATTSPAAEELRQRGQNLTDELRALWRGHDWIRVMVARLNAAGLDLEHDANIRAGEVLYERLGAEALHRERVQQALAARGIVTLHVPAATPLTTRSHPNRDKVASLLDEVVQEQAKREARERQLTRRRPADQHGSGRGSR